ncbi:helix-turn-helix domain-containing protein, partial [Ruegeria sp. 1NDH52C]|nr:helix-turn-helix domain-containing protein [Ruegeria alba]
RIPDTNLVREPLSKPVKEEEGAQAREAVFDQFFGDLLQALGLDPAALPGWWQGWPPRQHVQRWRDAFGLTEAEIIATAQATRQDHPEPPDGPKALDRAMQRAAQRKADEAGRKRRKLISRTSTPAATPSADVPAFYAAWVNSDSHLPACAISNTMRNAILARGLVTSDRMRERGVL